MQALDNINSKQYHGNALHKVQMQLVQSNLTQFVEMHDQHGDLLSKHIILSAADLAHTMQAAVSVKLPCL